MSKIKVSHLVKCMRCKEYFSKEKLKEKEKCPKCGYNRFEFILVEIEEE